MEPSNWVDLAGLVIPTLGLVITIIIFIIQQRKTRLLNSALMTSSFIDRFDSSEFRKFRFDFSLEAANLLEQKPADFAKCVPILGFFENIGYLVRRRVLDKEMIWNKFSWIVIRYFMLLNDKTHFIQQLREKEQDDKIYCEFEWLYHAMIRMHSRNGIINDPYIIFSNDYIDLRVRELMEQESGLL